MSSSKALHQVINTPLGKIGIRCYPERVEGSPSIGRSHHSRFALGRDDNSLQHNSIITNIEYMSDDSQETDNNHPASNELLRYFANPDHQFSITARPAGTAYQQRVWQAICDIPSGTTLTYGELARKLESSPRAVGQACRKNPIPIIIPCHRVVSASGMGGYAGATDGKLMAIKQWLLAHEASSS